ncbi:MAG: APC family permease [Acidimicrobiales bacterium]|nr:APC family permease [Acidimicrobiales bacterium]
MIGAGVFAAIGPAAAVAGGGLLIGLALAAVVAYCNATSSAQLAALYPASGGTYVYGRKRLGHLWGFLAGWGFVIGKTASCAAMALTFGSYVAPDLARPLGIGAVVALTAVNLRGVQKTALLTRVLVGVVLGALAVVVTAGLSSSPTTANIGPLTDGGVRGVLEAGALLFFAFAGYARIATLGEEVRDPARTIPRAIPIALGITLVVYTTVAVVSLCAVGPAALAATSAPLTTVAEASGWSWAEPVVRAGAAVASLGVLLSLLVGVSRTTFAMAGEADLPRWLDAVHPVHRIPHRAETVVAAAVIAVVLVADVRGAIGFSSFAVLFYYAVANASAVTLTASERRWPRPLAVAGMIGCVTLAVALPASSVIGGTVLLVSGAVVWALRRRLSRTPTSEHPDDQRG